MEDEKKREAEELHTGLQRAMEEKNSEEINRLVQKFSDAGVVDEHGTLNKAQRIIEACAFMDRKCCTEYN